MNLRFAKMSGAGNDFIVIDGRQQADAGFTPEFIRRACQRRLSIGADGLLVLLPSSSSAFTMRYYNADGSEADMCGNGGRCIARFAQVLGLAGPKDEIVFTTRAGQYRAWFQGRRVHLKLPPPTQLQQDLILPLAQGERTADFSNTGVPHAVFFTSHLDQEDVAGLGKEVRFHPRFQPAGTNVNFCEIVDEHNIRVRTYERGVEAETLACGTGSAAAALLAANRGWVQSPVSIATASGERLAMSFVLQAGNFEEVYQAGEVRLVFWGEMTPETTDY